VVKDKRLNQATNWILDR